MKKQKLLIVSILLCVFLVILNNNVIAQETQEQQLTKEQLKAFRSAKTACILVEQSYDEVKDVSLPFEDVTKRLLEYAGLKVVKSSDTKDYDLKLNIKAKGKAIKSKGTIINGTKSSLSGSISFEIQGIPVCQKSFKGESPPFMGDEFQILFDLAFAIQGSFIPTMIEMMRDIYDINCILSALKDEDWKVRIVTAGELGKMMNYQAVGPLISALKDEDRAVIVTASDALKNITGQDFGTDQEKWQKWWEENKEKFIKKEMNL